MPIYQTARFQVKPGALEICQQAIREFVDAIRADEPETRMYLALNQDDDPTRFLHVFIFENDIARDRHANSAAVKKFTAILYPNCVAPVAFTEYTFVAEK
ncbi:MAG: antibiotic biosynthesis monooxygenase [Chloroflexi bacterium]|nr:antibiotic biosynthesis monooxygenase [Chloroflexota bacterium]